MNTFKFVHSRNMGALRHVLRVALFNMPNSNQFDILSISIFSEIFLSLSISIFSKISLSISISIFSKISLSITIFSKMTISISIFFKSVDISTIDIRYSISIYRTGLPAEEGSWPDQWQH